MPKNQNLETQIILLYASKQDKLVEVSARLMRDHNQVMVKKEQQAWQVMPDYTNQQGGCENKIALVTEGTDEMDPIGTNMPSNKFDWIKEETHKSPISRLHKAQKTTR